ncbi:1-phosphofructokinase [Klebsiella variicola]|nr:1-phosphofructokinase [Klebsiella variicola]
MSRRVATITLNPAYDLVGFTPEIERGEVNLVRTTGLHAAGKGINVAKVLKDLGIDVTVGGFLGKDNQDGFQQLFSELGIANRFQVVQGRTRINVKLTEKDGEVTDFNFSGFEVTPGDWERFVNDSLSWLGQFRYGLRQRQPAVRRQPGGLHRLDDPSAQPVPMHYFRQQPRSAGCRTESGAMAGETEPSRAGDLGRA